MGGGTMDTRKLQDTLRKRQQTNTTFDYDRTVRSTGKYKAHESLDPKKLNTKGQNIRESRDNEEHPNSVPIAVIFDETGSMGNIPRVAQEKLAKLFGLLLRKGYVEDPQMLIGAYGDAHVDRVPLQLSQFESDNRVEENLNNLYLEGHGGGNGGESLELAWYYLAHHTSTDSFEKRGKKGYAFFIGDEVPLGITPEIVKKYIGDGEPLGSLKVEDIAKDMMKKWDVTMLVVNNGTSQYQGSLKRYQELLGKENVILLEEEKTMAETIGVIVGAKEGTLDSLDQAKEDLDEVGMDVAVIDNLKNHLTINDKGETSIVVDVPDLDL